MSGRDYTYKDVVDGTIQLRNWGDFATPKAWIERDNLMMLCFEWQDKVFLRFTEDEITSLTDEQRKLVEKSDGEDNGYHAWAVRMRDGQPVTSYKRVCNFRRYSWSESPKRPTRPDDGDNFGNGPCYANGTDGGLSCSSPEQVIRDTLVRFIAESKVPDELKYHVAVRPLWQQLLDDALGNISEHATRCVGRNNGACRDIRVNGELYSIA